MAFPVRDVHINRVQAHKGLLEGKYYAAVVTSNKSWQERTLCRVGLAFNQNDVLSAYATYQEAWPRILLLWQKVLGRAKVEFDKVTDEPSRSRRDGSYRVCSALSVDRESDLGTRHRTNRCDKTLY